MSATDKGGKRISKRIEHRCCGFLRSLLISFWIELICSAVFFFIFIFCRMSQVHHGPGWGSSLCCWSGCDIARCGDNCASYCLASAGDDQLQKKTMTMGIPFVVSGIMYWMELQQIVLMQQNEVCLGYLYVFFLFMMLFTFVEPDFSLLNLIASRIIFCLSEIVFVTDLEMYIVYSCIFHMLYF